MMIVLVVSGLYEGELAIVSRQLHMARGYEVTLLSRHEPGSMLDPVFVFGEDDLRLATPDEVEERFQQYEKKHNYKLRR